MRVCRASAVLSANGRFTPDARSQPHRQWDTLDGVLEPGRRAAGSSARPAIVDLFWQYVLVFLAAATPWLEIVIVIPVAIGLGLAPVPVTLISFIGNALPVFGIVALFRVWERRRGPIRRHWSPRARRVWERYGVPGIALAGPAITGIHLAAVMALALQADRRRTAVWMTLSLALWSVVTAAVSVAGFEGLRWLFGEH
jgi:Ca2+/H+ antiporter, TMEM165/GDT1 family